MDRPASRSTWTAPRGPIRLGVRYRRTVNVVAAGVWATGCLWLVFHYFLRQPGVLGPEPHPLEVWWLRLHGAFAFGALWTLGMLSASHLINGWASRRRRRSGANLLAFAVVLTVSGYLLYYAGGDRVRPALAVLHWSVGLAAPLAFVWHRFLSTRGRGRSGFTDRDASGTGGL